MGNQSSSSVSFHIVRDKGEARQLLEEAERKDSYLEECDDHYANSLAREESAYAPNTITDADHTLFRAVVEEAKDKIPLRLVYDLPTVHLIQLMPSAEGGMPHTRPDAIICYPNLSRFFSTSTLIHELWHIHQRLYAHQWTQIFEALGWKPWSQELPPQLEANRRINPDTVDSPLWCFQQTWVPVPIFQDVTHPKMNEIHVWFYHVTLKYHVKKVPTELSALFKKIPLSAYEHPREWAAYLLSDPVVYGGTPMFTSLVQQIGGLSLPRGRVH